MANAFGSLSGILVVQEALDSLLVQFPALRQITTDFSAQQAKLNQQITTRVIVPTTAVVFNAGAGYAASDRTAVDVPITIDTHIHHTFAVTDIERSKTSRDLRKELVATSAHALGKKLMDSLFALVLNANFAQNYHCLNANFDRDQIVKIRTGLNKLFVPDLNRFMILNSDFYQGASFDTSIVGGLVNPDANGAIRSGVLPNVHGFSISEYASLPANGETLGGIAGNKEALLIATRLPDVPTDIAIPGTIGVVTEPNTGLSVQVRQYYDMKMGVENFTMTLMYGVGVGLSDAGVCNRLVRIMDAA